MVEEVHGGRGDEVERAPQSRSESDDDDLAKSLTALSQLPRPGWAWWIC